MSEDVGALVARVIADTEGFRSEMTRLANQVQSNTARMNAQLSKIGKASDALAGSFRLVTRVAAAFGVALSARALVQFTTQSINAAAELQNLSVRLNASVESLSELQYVARLTDVDFQSFTTSLTVMTRNFGEASKGSKSMQDTFARLGLDFKLLSGLSVDQQLEAVAEALNRVGNESERAALRQEVFGKSGAVMEQALEGGAEAVRRMRQEARDLGAVLSTETAKSADAAKDAIDRMKAAITPLSNELVNVLAPRLEVIANKLREAFFPTDAEKAVDDAKRALEAEKRLLREAQELRQSFLNENQNPDLSKEQRDRLDELTRRVSVFRSQVMDAQFALDSLLSTPAGSGQKPSGVPGLVTPSSQLIDTEALAKEGQLPTMALQEKLDGIRELEEQKTAIMQEELDKQLQAATDVAQAKLDIAKYQAEQEIAYRHLVTDSAVGLLQALGSKHRGAAIAALAIQKALAVKEIFVQSQVAAMRAMAELGPIAGPPVAAAILAKGKLSAILVAATGLVEAAQLSSGGVQSTLGTTANPVATRSTSSTGTAVMPHKRDVTEIHFHGDVYGWDDYIERKVVDGLRTAMEDREVVLFTADSRQGQLLGATV